MHAESYGSYLESSECGAAMWSKAHDALATETYYIVLHSAEMPILFAVNSHWLFCLACSHSTCHTTEASDQSHRIIGAYMLAAMQPSDDVLLSHGSERSGQVTTSIGSPGWTWNRTR